MMDNDHSVIENKGLLNRRNSQATRPLIKSIDRTKSPMIQQHASTIVVNDDNHSIDRRSCITDVQNSGFHKMSTISVAPVKKPKNMLEQNDSLSSISQILL
jgi:predicted HAD superfamily phosphohydrolase YqeG